MKKIKSLSKALRNRVEIYEKKAGTNELGETTYSYSLVQKVWAEILPTRAGNKEESLKGEVLRTRTTHKITVRQKAINRPMNDMYFMYKGQKYEVMYFMPNYKSNDYIEFYCKLITETEEDYGYDAE